MEVYRKSEVKKVGNRLEPIGPQQKVCSQLNL